jgi:hypothetical protein
MMFSCNVKFRYLQCFFESYFFENNYHSYLTFITGPPFLLSISIFYSFEALIDIFICEVLVSSHRDRYIHRDTNIVVIGLPLLDGDGVIHHPCMRTWWPTSCCIQYSWFVDDSGAFMCCWSYGAAKDEQSLQDSGRYDAWHSLSWLRSDEPSLCLEMARCILVVVFARECIYMSVYIWELSAADMKGWALRTCRPFVIRGRKWSYNS